MLSEVCIGTERGLSGTFYARARIFLPRNSSADISSCIWSPQPWDRGVPGRRLEWSTTQLSIRALEPTVSELEARGFDGLAFAVFHHVVCSQ